MHETPNLIYTSFDTFLLHAQNGNLAISLAAGTPLINTGPFFLSDGTQDVCRGSLQEIPD